MATKAKAVTKKTPQDAIALLKADHQKVSGLFEQYESARATTRKKSLAAQICTELSVHAQIEDEIFYPKVKAALKDHELIPEAIVEHDSLKKLIAEIRGKEPDGEMYDAKVKVLSEYVKHHVKEEQTEMFPKAKKTKLDMKAIGAELLARKTQLLAQMP